ncbi:hypothetical protein HHI36_016343, partial [Cryptolaemus montrouzieri]
MEIHLKKQAAIYNRKQLPVSHLKNPMVKQHFTEKINEELSKIDLTPSSEVNIKWETLKTTIMAPTTDLLATIKDTNKSNILLDKNGKIILDTKGKLERWKEYIEELFEDERQQETIYGDTAKNNKAPGPDETPTKIIKLIAEDQ